MRKHAARGSLLTAIALIALHGCSQLMSDPATRLADALHSYTQQLAQATGTTMTFSYSVESNVLTTFLFLPSASVTRADLDATGLPLLNRLTGELYPGELVIIKETERLHSLTTMHRKFIEMPDHILGVAKRGGTLRITLRKIEGSAMAKLIAVE